MTKKLQHRKAISFVISLAMVFTLIIGSSGLALAIDPDNATYLSNDSATTNLTTIVTVGDIRESTPLDVGLLDASYNFGGFDFATQAALVNWAVGLSTGGIIAGSIAETTPPYASTGTFLSEGTVTLTANAIGVASIVVTYPSVPALPSFNLTVAADPVREQSGITADTFFVSATGIAPYDVIISSAGIAVESASASGGYSVGGAQALQNVADPMDVLDSLTLTGQVSSATLTDDGSYLSDVTINGIGYPATSTSPYLGWIYAVYDTHGNIVPITQIVAASAYPIQEDGDSIVWKYGPYGISFAATLSDEIASWS